MRHHVALLIALAAVTAGAPFLASAQLPGGQILNNGVIQVEVNGVAPPGYRYPCITRVWVEGALIVPPIAVGALFQMDVRSDQGDNYNPTQSGACSGAPSQLAAWQDGWAFLGPQGNPNGLLMGVVPRTFESSTGQCTAGVAAPYYFNWGMQLGDDVNFPKEAMLIEQTFQKTSAAAPNILSVGVEIPTVYYGCDFALFAYYLPYDSPTDWQPLNHPLTGANYVPNWPVGNGFLAPGYGNMRCNGNTAAAMCAATYTAIHNSTCGGTNNGAEGCPANLVPDARYEITDQGVYGRLAIFAVGNMGTVSAALSQTAAKFSASAWGNLV